MPSQFPGMDPFLEHAAVFPDLHDALIFCLREALNARLKPPYFASGNSRAWMESASRHAGPDVNVLRGFKPENERGAPLGGGVATAEKMATQPVVVHVWKEEARESYLEIYADPGQERLVTSLEVLSISNKTRGTKGRKLYRKKQREMLSSKVNLVEIDLLRGGEHSTVVPKSDSIN